MTNVKINQLAIGLRLLFAALFITLSTSSTTLPSDLGTVNCVPSPSVVSQSSGSVEFSWPVVSSAQSYKIWYVRKSTGLQGGVIITSNRSVSYDNLPSGAYDFYFSADCGNGYADYLIIEDMIL